MNAIGKTALAVIFAVLVCGALQGAPAAWADTDFRNYGVADIGVSALLVTLKGRFPVGPLTLFAGAGVGLLCFFGLGDRDQRFRGF